MANHHGQDSSSPQPAVTIPAATQQAIAGFLEYLAVERRLAEATQAAYQLDLNQFFSAWQQQAVRRISIC